MRTRMGTRDEHEVECACHCATYVPRQGRPHPPRPSPSLGPKSEEGPRGTSWGLVGPLGLACIGGMAQRRRGAGGLDSRLPARALPAPVHARLICWAPWLRKHPLMHRLLQRLPAPANKTHHSTPHHTHHTPHIASPSSHAEPLISLLYLAIPPALLI